ncbi:MAG: DUF4293 family protein [Crocinitomicaceae bacterium]|nr:DUF4293 family protein [Crocinitomicaceae bacterium]
MIQRIQSIYYILAMICLSLLLSGMEIFRFVGSKTYYVFSAFGLESGNVSDPQGNLQPLSKMPFFLTLISFILFIFIALMGYKNLTRQFKLARTIFFIYLLLIVSLVIFAIMGGGMLSADETKRELGLGFFFFVLGFPFCFLAQLGIKRDKKLLDSLNRLR